VNDNKAFAAWVLLVLTTMATLLTWIVVGLGADLPPLASVLEHVALGLSIRFAYKYTGGFNPADWSFGSDAVGEPVAAGALDPGVGAGAMG
jgi:hypothetical protein